MEEKWTQIPGFTGYEVSDLGRVRRGEEIVSPYRYKYLTVGLPVGDRRHPKRIHRLVLTAFVGPCPVGMVCCHNNGDRHDNRLENLRWDTPASNVNDMRIHGTIASGDRSGSRKYPERLPHGDAHWTRATPERVQRGDAHYSKRNPELVARGDRNGSRTRPDRVARGERHGASKLTDAQALEIIRSDEHPRVLAVRYGISREQAARIKRGVSRAHLQR